MTLRDDARVFFPRFLLDEICSVFVHEKNTEKMAAMLKLYGASIIPRIRWHHASVYFGPELVEALLDKVDDTATREELLRTVNAHSMAVHVLRNGRVELAAELLGVVGPEVFTCMDYNSICIVAAARNVRAFAWMQAQFPHAVHTKKESGWTPLMQAIAQNDFAAVYRLLTAGARPSDTTSWGSSAIQISFSHGKLFNLLAQYSTGATMWDHMMAPGNRDWVVTNFDALQYALTHFGGDYCWDAMGAAAIFWQLIDKLEWLHARGLLDAYALLVGETTREYPPHHRWNRTETYLWLLAKLTRKQCQSLKRMPMRQPYLHRALISEI